MQFVGKWVVDEFTKMMSEVKRGEFSRMDPMHHILSGLKSTFTESMIINIEQARRSCGGAGYTSNSGFTELSHNSSPMPTYEGDNVVMLG